MFLGLKTKKDNIQLLKNDWIKICMMFNFWKWPNTNTNNVTTDTNTNNIQLLKMTINAIKHIFQISKPNKTNIITNIESAVLSSQNVIYGVKSLGYLAFSSIFDFFLTKSESEYYSGFENHWIRIQIIFGPKPLNKHE